MRVTSPARRTGSLSVAVALPVMLAIACTEADQPSRTYIVRDSSEVRVVQNVAPLWGDDDAWQIAEVPSVEIGDASGEGLGVFSEIAAVVRLSDGRIVVGDGASGTLRFFDARGTALGIRGGRGEGPGEYQELSHISIVSGDSIVVMDAVLQRVTVLGPDGVFVRSAQLSAAQVGGYATPHGLLEGGSILVSVSELATSLGSGLQRRSASLLAVDLETGKVNRLASILGPQEILEGSRSIGYLFGVDTEVATSASEILLMSTDQAVVTKLGIDGETKLIFSWPVESKAVTQELLTMAMAERIANFPAGVSTRTIERLRERRLDETVAPHLPNARSLTVDAKNNVWVESFPVPGEGQASYLIFRPDGVWLGSLALPDGLKRGTIPQFDPALEIGDGYILGVWVDELGVEFVREYQLKRGSP